VRPSLNRKAGLGSALLLLMVLASGRVPARASEVWTLASPNGRCAISVFLESGGTLTYEVLHNGNKVIRKSPLGVRRTDENFERALFLQSAGENSTSRERYELFAGTTPRVDHVLRHRSLVFRNADRALLEIELAAGNEGVAFRYRFPEESTVVRVLEAESTGFTLPLSARGWLQPYHAAGPYTPAYEDFYFDVAPGERPPNSRAKAVGWAFPALFHIPGAASWVLLTESGTDASFCACHLDDGSSNGMYRVAFPLANETTKGWTNRFGPEPRWTLPWTMPWRVFVMGESAAEIAMATLVTDLAPPSRLSDVAWIKPGRASWAWWSYPDGPTSAELFDRFTDFAARMGWEYTLFDAGWWKTGLKPISAYAESKGIVPLAWSFAADFYDARKRNRKLDELLSGGVRGVKVDFWCSDRQEAIAAMQALFEDAAHRRMLVVLHGCTVPRGWQRTWPNLLTVEAVLGTESYFYEPRYPEKAAELNTVLPFTRNAIGPMDTTPVACSPKKYLHLTTAAHELATAIILTSGLIHYADKPEFFESLPGEAQQIFRDAPARWDETRCLVGVPGRVVVFARRANNSWFIAGLNGTEARLPLELDLSPFKAFRKRVLIAEGPEPAMEVSVLAVPANGRLKHDFPPRGGFILRLDK